MITIFNIIVTVLLGLAAIVSAWYFAKKYRGSKLRITWGDISEYVNQVANDVMSAGFKPDIILSSAGPCTIAAILIGMKIDEEIPVYTMQQKKAKDRTGNWTTDPFDIPGVEALTDKWRTLIPKHCLDNTARKVLVVHDAVLSGRVISAVRGQLVSSGFDEENVKTAALIKSKGPEHIVPPDFYAKLIEGSDVVMPWGHISRSTRIKLQREKHGLNW